MERRSELTKPPPDPDQELIDAFAAGGRALVALTASSLAEYEARVTLPQYRALVVLRTRGPQRPAQLAERLAVDPSTASRMIERLVRKRLVRRERLRTDRRTVRVFLTEAGVALVDNVTGTRREQIRLAVAAMPQVDRQSVIGALQAFVSAVDEPQEQPWPDPLDSDQP